MSNLKINNESTEELLDERVDRATEATLNDFHAAMREARPLLSRELYDLLETTFGAHRLAVAEAAFTLGYEAATQPAAWLFRKANTEELVQVQ